MFVLDVDNMTYSKETTGKKFYGEGGSFENEPDQTIFGPTRRYLYFTEGGGNPGVFSRYGEDRTYFSMFQATKMACWCCSESGSSQILCWYSTFWDYIH